jgi:type IV pilus assembly protein PilW
VAATGSGFCSNSYGLIASCTSANVFTVSAAASSATSTTLTLAGNLGANSYTTAGAEVFPLQTTTYYVKRSSSGTTTSLYRRVFDGNDAAGLEQELIEGVETLQIRYGVDTSATADGMVDSYVTADQVASWPTVVAVRMSVLLRADTPVEADVSVPASGLVNGVQVTYPSGTSVNRYDRRIFTTTVAVRNKIAFF